LGRWINRDPLGETGGLNLYGFVNNNPNYYADPDGRWWMVIGGAIGGGLELVAQLIGNGGDLSDVDWGNVGGATLAGAVGGGLGSRYWSWPSICKLFQSTL
jgi:uncharacterized protein RhaS with RHS repeats